MIKANFTKLKVKGFTLVETLVAISILMVSVAGPLVLVGNGIKASAFARDQITAFYLAQDAIEAIRYIRDNNRIDKVLSSDPDLVPWDALSEYSCLEASPCGIDTVEIYNGGGGIENDTYNDFLLFTTDGKYAYDVSGTPSKFKRSIVINPINSNEVEITVRVDWSSGVITRQFSITENLFYWY